MKNKILSAVLIKHFYSQVINSFVEVSKKALWGKVIFL